jgi:hypothetical protein
MAISLPAEHVQEVTQAFAVADPDAVASHLSRHTSVLPHLAALVLPQAKAIYGNGTELSLRRDRDPDAGGDYLVVGVRTTLAPPEAHRLLSELRARWWATAPSDIDRHVLIANDFI